MGARGERARRSEGGAKGSEAYCKIGFRVPTTSVGARGEGVKGSEGGEVYCILGLVLGCRGKG